MFAWRHLAINSDRLLSSSSVLGQYDTSDFLLKQSKHLLAMFEYDGTVFTMYYFKTGVSLYFFSDVPNVFGECCVIMISIVVERFFMVIKTLIEISFSNS